MLLPGQTLRDFKVVRPLGRGGFGDVYEARHVLMDRPVALKVLVCGQQPSAQQVEEARLLASLSHPNIVQIHDAGLYADPQTGETCFYLAMELVRGGSLRDQLISRGRIPVPEAARIATALCDALAYAHSQDIVHRDIKPENILLTEDGTPKLADFGVSRLLSESQIASSIVGTAPYIAPEGWEGATHQSDIWSLGAVLYEMLAGSPPFVGKTPAEVEQRIKKARHRPLRDVVPGIPPQVEEAVNKALEKRPSRRFAKAGDLAQALRPLAEGLAAKHDITEHGAPRSAMWPVVTFRRAARGVARFVAAKTVETVVGLVAIALFSYAGLRIHGPMEMARDVMNRISGQKSPVVARTASVKPQQYAVPPAPNPATPASKERPGGHAGPTGHDASAGTQSADRPAADQHAPAAENSQILYDNAQTKLRAGERTAGIQLLKRCVAADPHHVKAHTQLAMLYGDDGQTYSAIEEWETVVKLAPDKLGARLTLARAYHQTGQAEKAAAQWREVLRLDPENDEAKQALGSAP